MTPAQFEDAQLGALAGYLVLALSIVGYICLEWLERARARRNAPSYLQQMRAVCQSPVVKRKGR